MKVVFNRIEFGARVLAAMNGRSCRDVAREAGVSAATLNRVTRGEMPSVPVYLTLSAWLTPSQRLDAATVERCAQVADEAAARNLQRSEELRQSADQVDVEYSVAFHRKHIEASKIATDIRALATEPHQHGAGNGEKHGG